jgi:tetratricopeptide (TPR) repeat protein
LDPESAFAWTGKGNALRDLKRYQEALEAYDRRLALAPATRSALEGKARALQALGRIQEANALEAEAKRLST